MGSWQQSLALRNAPASAFNQELPAPLRVIQIVLMLLFTLLGLRRTRLVVLEQRRPVQPAMPRIARLESGFCGLRTGRVIA